MASFDQSSTRQSENLKTLCCEPDKQTNLDIRPEISQKILSHPRLGDDEFYVDRKKRVLHRGSVRVVIV